MDPGGSALCERRFYVCALLALLTIAAGALLPSRALATPGFKYKLHMIAEGKSSVEDSEEEEPGESRKQHAEWTFRPEDVYVWIPQFNGPPGQANARQEETFALDERPMGSTIGQIIESGSFVGPERSEGIYCEAGVAFTGAVIQRVIVTELDPTIELETDFHGSLDAVNKPGEVGSAVGEPCWHNAHGDEGSGHFHYEWDNPHGQRMQVGMLIPQQEIGDPTISGPAEDYNNVQASTELPEDCFPNAVTTCKATFKLGGEYELEKVCEGSYSGTSWSCNSGTGSTGGQGNENKNPPADKGPAGNPPASGTSTSQQKTADKASQPSKGAKGKGKKKQAKEQKGVTVKIKSAKVTASGLQVKIKVSAGGTVTLSGSGLTKTSKTMPAGTHTLTVEITKKAASKRQKAKLTVILKAGKKTVGASKQVTL